MAGFLRPKGVPAAGDSNPTWFIAKFQRNRPLPPYSNSPIGSDDPSLKSVQSLGHERADVKPGGSKSRRAQRPFRMRRSAIFMSQVRRPRR